MLAITQSGRTARFSVLVQPRAARSEVVGEHGDALKIRIAAPPVEGAANEELVRFLAKRLKVPASSVRVAAGERGRRKIVEIDGASSDQIVALLSGVP